MEIVCSISTTVRTLEQHCLDAAQFMKEYHADLESWLHSCSSGRHLGNLCQTQLVFCSLYIEAFRHVICKNSVVNSIVHRKFILDVIVLIRSLSSRCQVLLLC
jgi:hypothetical protein